MSQPKPIRIAYVPEHYSLPLHLSQPLFSSFHRNIPPITLHPFPSGTGAMITSLRANEIDLAIGLTEGWIAGIGTAEGRQKAGYKVVGSWVETKLRWGVYTGRSRESIGSITDLKGGKVGVSRIGRYAPTAARTNKHSIAS